MKYSARSLRLAFVITLLLFVAAIVPAQNRERFGISARAGGVNAVVGQVTVDRVDQAPTLLTSSDDLKSGDVVTADARSYAEILLNPGSYLRLRANSKFQFEDTSLDHLRVKLLQGSVIVEATGIDDMDLNIHVVTAQADFTIMRGGVYRIEAQPNFAELAVRKGRAAFGPNKTDVVKGGNTVTFQNGQMARGKASNDKDDFDLWSNERAQLLARANERLSARTFNGYLASLSAWDTNRWNSWGLWAFNPRAGFYTFMPFRYGWSSPYGHHYRNYCNYIPHWRGNGQGGWTGGRGGSGGGSGSGGFIGGGSGGSGSAGSSGSSGPQGSFGGSSSPGRSQPAPSNQGSGGARVHQSRQP